MSILKQWASPSVCFAHGYDKMNNIDLSCHHNFLNFLNLFSKEVFLSILDIGCGSGRIVKGLPMERINYTGADLNTECIRIAQESFANISNATFEVFDIDLQNVENLGDGRFDIGYFDSTLTMFEDPFSCLSKVCRACTIVYIGRTPITRKETVKNFYKWGGMSEPSAKWEFCLGDIQSVLPDSSSLIPLGPLDLLIINGSFDQKNKNFNIL